MVNFPHDTKRSHRLTQVLIALDLSTSSSCSLLLFLTSRRHFFTCCWRKLDTLFTFSIITQILQIIVRFEQELPLTVLTVTVTVALFSSPLSDCRHCCKRQMLIGSSVTSQGWREQDIYLLCYCFLLFQHSIYLLFSPLHSTNLLLLVSSSVLQGKHLRKQEWCLFAERHTWSMMHYNEHFVIQLLSPVLGYFEDQFIHRCSYCRDATTNSHQLTASYHSMKRERKLFLLTIVCLTFAVCRRLIHFEKNSQVHIPHVSRLNTLSRSLHAPPLSSFTPFISNQMSIKSCKKLKPLIFLYLR